MRQGQPCSQQAGPEVPFRCHCIKDSSCWLLGRKGDHAREGALQQHPDSLGNGWVITQTTQVGMEDGAGGLCGLNGLGHIGADLPWESTMPQLSMHVS